MRYPKGVVRSIPEIGYILVLDDTSPYIKNMHSAAIRNALATKSIYTYDIRSVGGCPNTIEDIVYNDRFATIISPCEIGYNMHETIGLVDEYYMLSSTQQEHLVSALLEAIEYPNKRITIRKFMKLIQQSMIIWHHFN